MRRRLLVLTVCLTAALPSSAAITGTVVNSDGQAIAGAKVTMYTLELPQAMRERLMAGEERTPLAATTSDSKGKFTFESPRDPVVAIHILASGYAPIGMHVERDDARGAIALTAAPDKKGRITAGGKPVAGARVGFMSSSQFIATTDADGRYTVPDPSKWADRIVVLHPDYAIIAESTMRFPSSGKVALDRTLDSGATITGRVVGEDGKTPVAGATLTVDNWPAGKTGEDGSFSVAHAPRKWESLQARNGNLLGERARSAKEPLVVKLGKTANVSGSVHDAKSKIGLAGVELRIRPASRPDFTGVVASTITDAKGNFSMAGVPPGSYEIVPIRPGYSIPGATLSIAAGEKALKNLVATQFARVSGFVLNENKEPIAGARLQAPGASRDQMMFVRAIEVPTRNSISGPDGAFVADVRPDQDSQIHAQKKGYPSGTSTMLRLTPGERKAGVNITIPLGYAVTGTVTDRKGRPLSGVTIAATEATGVSGATMVRRMAFSGMRQEEDFVRTANDGTFSIRVKEGTWDLSFKAPGYASKTVRAQQVNASTKPVEVTLDPGEVITGSVTRGGTGVEGVRIMLLGDLPISTETGPDGSFRIEDLNPGQTTLMAGKQEDFIQQMRSITIPSNEPINIELPPGGRIAGRVVDKETKQPVTSFDAGISASRGGAMMVMGPPMSRHFTSDDGSFVLENVPPGAMNVIVNAPGYTSGRVSNVKVEDGKTIADVEVQMDHGVKVTGRVTGPDGAGLAGVTVRFDMSPGGMMRGGPMNMSSAATDSNGEYTLEAVEPGEKTFLFNRSGYLQEQKTVELSGHAARVDAQLSSGLRVSGVVVSDGGVPIADASVFASSPSDAGFGGRSARTDSNGAFQLEGLSPARYTFRASKAGSGSGQLRDYDISGGAPIRIVMATGGTITGRVNGLTADELQQATVRASSATGNASGPVDANGNFRIEGAPTGTVRVTAMVGMNMPGGGKTSPVKSVQLEPGGSAQVDIDFARNTVRGRVTYDGKAAPQVMVMFSPQKAQAQTMARTTTDANGNYEASGLDDASYDVQVFDMQRGTPYRTTHEVKGSSTFNIDIKSTTVRGRVLDSSTGQAVEEAAIQIREQTSSGPRFGLRTMMTDASGAFTLDNVAPGTYSVSAEKEGYGTKVIDVTVGDSPADLEIKLASNAGVTLRVVDARDGRQLSAFIRVLDAKGKIVYESPMRFGGGGAESLKLPLEAGTYRATIMTTGYATKTVNVTSPSSPTIAMTPGGSIAVQSKGSALRRARLVSPDGREYLFGMNPIFTIDPSPGTTVMENIAPGMYTLQILGAGDRVESSAPVSVLEGQRATVEI